MLRVCDKFENGVRVYDLKKILLIGGALIVASGIMTLLYNYTIIRYVILLAVAVIAFCFRKRILGVFAEMKNKKS
jgi:hypothetical protein